MTTPTYIEHDGIVDRHPSYYGQACELVGRIRHTDCPDDDTFVVRFADGREIEVFPEELDPIPAA